MSDGSFRGDCGRCDALCCTALAFDRGPHFAIDKPAGVACPNLTEHQCAIHDRLAARGFSGCAAYDCRGAGQLATAMFAGLDPAADAVRRARFEAFARLRRIQILRLALQRFGHQVQAPASYAELLVMDVDALRDTLVAHVLDARDEGMHQMPPSSDTLRKSP
jgi:hypothetical protein